MTDEKRAAVERRRRVHAGESSQQVYSFVPAGSRAAAERIDVLFVEQQYLVEHPADDDEPVIPRSQVEAVLKGFSRTR